MTKKWNIFGDVMAVLIVAGVVACAVIASPPQDLVAKHDHAWLVGDGGEPAASDHESKAAILRPLSP